MKAEIMQIGTFKPDGTLNDDWIFNCKGEVPAFSFDDRSGKMEVKIGGYTAEELRQISDTHFNLNPK